MRKLPAVAFFTATALAIALTAGAGLGLWLLLDRLYGLPLLGLSWLALVQVHGTLQLFGFAGLFVMGVGLHVLPRFRGATPPPRIVVAAIYAAMVVALAARAIAQPLPELPARGAILEAGGLALVAGTLLYALTAVRVLASGTHPHRPDELVIALGVCVLPVAATLAALGTADAPLIVDPARDEPALWTMLLGALAPTIFGVWARLGPGFVASRPARPIPLLAGVVLWSAGAAGLAAGVAAAPWLLLVAGALVTWTLGVFGPTIAHQPLAGHARLTRFTVRSAFAWLGAGIGVLIASSAGVLGDGYFVASAARHAFALGFVTLMVYGVAARAIPAFLGRAIRSPRLQLAAIVLTEAGVALRVVPQALGGIDRVSNALVGASGILAYAGLVAFAASLVRTLAARPVPERTASAGAAVEVRLGTFGPRR